MGIKRVVVGALDRFGYQVHKRDDGGFDPATRDTLKFVEPFTMTSPERVNAACEAARYITRYDIPGAVVECGVWRGGSIMAIARTLLECGDDRRDLYLFDTFEGMPEPTARDRTVADGHSAEGLLASQEGDPDRVWARASIEDVRRNVASVGYPADRIHFIAGRVEDTIPLQAPNQIALLRLDTDWYESTKHELAHLSARVAPSGVMIIDDYGHWQGARQAVDEWLDAQQRPVFLSRVDYTGRLAILH